jgi:glycosyltransferase involved in cell wall biosynthesis
LPAAPRVLSVGNDRAYKNLEATIKALGQPALAHASLVRVGPITPAQRALATSNGVSRRTFVPGALGDEQLALLNAACDVLAQPSLAEGFGIPVIEAMACGLPVVVSDGGALPEVVAGAGVVVALGEDFPRRFGLGLVEAFERGPELRSAGIERARAFAPEAVLPTLLEAYERAVSKRISR